MTRTSAYARCFSRYVPGSTTRLCAHPRCSATAQADERTCDLCDESGDCLACAQVARRKVGA